MRDKLAKSNKADGGTWNLYLFADLRCLGRDSQEAAPEISTLFRVLRHLGVNIK